MSKFLVLQKYVKHQGDLDFVRIEIPTSQKYFRPYNIQTTK